MSAIDEKLANAGIAVARPGDRLIVAFNHPITAQQADQFKRRLAELAPDLQALFMDGVQSVTIQRVEDQ